MNIIDRIGVFLDKGEVDKVVINSFSENKNITFPITYVDIISEYNQLYPEKNIFDFKKDNFEDERDFVFLGYGENSSENIEDISCDTYGYDNIVIFGRSANGDYIAFDYRKNPQGDNPEIVLLHHDEYIKDESGEPKLLVVKIADDFESFIDMLHE